MKTTDTHGPAAEHSDYLEDDIGPHQGETEDDHRSPDEEDTYVAD